MHPIPYKLLSHKVTGIFRCNILAPLPQEAAANIPPYITARTKGITSGSQDISAAAINMYHVTAGARRTKWPPDDLRYHSNNIKRLQRYQEKRVGH